MVRFVHFPGNQDSHTVEKVSVFTNYTVAVMRENRVDHTEKAAGLLQHTYSQTGKRIFFNIKQEPHASLFPLTWLRVNRLLGVSVKAAVLEITRCRATVQHETHTGKIHATI